MPVRYIWAREILLAFSTLAAIPAIYELIRTRKAGWACAIGLPISLALAILAQWIIR